METEGPDTLCVLGIKNIQKYWYHLLNATYYVALATRSCRVAVLQLCKAILKRDNHITSVELLNTEHDSVVEHTEQISNEFIWERGIRLDLVARASDGELLNIVLHR